MKQGDKTNRLKFKALRNKIKISGRSSLTDAEREFLRKYEIGFLTTMKKHMISEDSFNTNFNLSSKDKKKN